jgi:hypothetical protein
MQGKGYIRPSKSPYASPFFFVRKKDGKLQPVQDYCELNEFTIRNRYPLPLIPDLISQVRDTQIFTKFDVCEGYNNVLIKEGDQHKAVFKTKYGLWEPLVMFFGLTNSLATFQAMMDYILEPIINLFRGKGMEIIAYMDDILIATSASLEQHREAVHGVLNILEQILLSSPRCISTAPRVNPEASTSISNCLSSCGCAKTGSDVICFLSSLNASWCFSSHVHGMSFLVSLLRGQAMWEN